MNKAGAVENRINQPGSCFLITAVPLNYRRERKVKEGRECAAAVLHCVVGGIRLRNGGKQRFGEQALESARLKKEGGRPGERIEYHLICFSLFGSSKPQSSFPCQV
jgi:hypothetical protein